MPFSVNHTSINGHFSSDSLYQLSTSYRAKCNGVHMCTVLISSCSSTFIAPNICGTARFKSLSQSPDSVRPLVE